ncbi:hypothetical protein DYB32_008237 [Aphanomyces invadans]|uniref:Uncharacterized protein n=1 Tax=Aphanomyces invadans TaxID=157072 RepID=A0A3R6WH52_9STRA|nr:hypothetical protein DYB32_008237 [Aphanomyces invadans]
MAEQAYDEQSLWRDRNKVLVAGLPMAADDAALAAKFEPFGPMFQAKVVLDNNTGKSRGFGFVTFQTYESALDAVRGMDQSVGCTTVFVGNMPYEITEDLLRKVMSVCGEIKAIRFAEDITTKEFRGFGYVQFFEGEACEKAVQTLHGAVVMGRPLKVDYGARDAPQVTEAKEVLQKKLKKGICHKFQQGLCDRGDACKFAHVESIAPTTIDLAAIGATTHSTKALNNVPVDAPVCMAFQNGKCKRGNQCNYRHMPSGAGATASAPQGADEPISDDLDDDDDDDSPICLAFQKGKCKRGELCKYRHKAPHDTTPKSRLVRPAASAAVGAPVVDSMASFQAAIPVVRSTGLSSTATQTKHNSPAIPSTSVDTSIPICQSYLKGMCKRGGKCKYRHDTAGASTQPNDSIEADEQIVCPRFLRKGKCKRGDMCKYVHTSEPNARAETTPMAHPVEQEDTDSLTPTCLSFQKGACKRGDKCKFRHVTPVEPCQRFLQGKCTKGSLCAFSHGSVEDAPPAKKAKY